MTKRATRLKLRQCRTSTLPRLRVGVTRRALRNRETMSTWARPV
jgi:hypothetical protein